MFVSPEVPDLILRSLLLSATAVIWIVIVVRVVGLRAFSKMTAFDFVVTVATGSLLAGASQATTWSGYIQATLSMASLLGVQYATARLRKTFDTFENLVQNSPMLLMRDGVFLDAALKKTRVAKDDLIAKLREANVLEYSQVRAVVLETTGDISVIHGENLEDNLLIGVKRI